MISDLVPGARTPLIPPFIKPLQRRDSRGLRSRSDLEKNVAAMANTAATTTAAAAAQ